MPPHAQETRDVTCAREVWQAFEQMAADFGQDLDQLLSDALRAFAEEKGELAEEPVNPKPARSKPTRSKADAGRKKKTGKKPVGSTNKESPRGASLETELSVTTPGPKPDLKAGATNLSGEPSVQDAVHGEDEGPGVSSEGAQGSENVGVRPDRESPRPGVPPPLPVGAADPPPPPVSRRMSPRVPVAVAPETARGRLTLTYENQRYEVSKDAFLIGRGVKTSDLLIRDGNISRKHAVIVKKDGLFFIKDLGSTNGIEFHGARIATKQIQDGDVFKLCDHTLRFAFASS